MSFRTALVLASLTLLATLAPLVVGVGPAPVALADGGPAITLERVANGLQNPLLVTHAGDGSGRVFIVEQNGRIKVLGEAGNYLDISSKVTCCGERGLLGLAFAPDFETSGRLYVSYSRAGDSAATLERLTVADPANGKPPTSGQVLLTVPDIYPNHNGGMLAFGPDGMLYWSTGDGGSGGDPQGNGQNVNVLLGKLLRLDVSGSGYTIPSGNPFAGGGGRPEIWAYGLRNPWRFSFDRANGDLWIADVGQNVMEEVNVQSSRVPGINYGWDAFEGILPYQPGGATPDPSGKTFPQITYLHQPHCSVTGGYRYRGTAEADLAGWYLYGDYCSGVVWGATETAPGVWTSYQLADTNHSISSFGEDESGEMYLVHLGGAVYRIHA